MSRHESQNKNAQDGFLSTINLALHKHLKLETPIKKRSKIRVMEVKKGTYGGTL